MEEFYKKLEDRFRGKRENVKEKLKIYLPLLKHKEKRVIDIGCGRGEFLELLAENGFNDLIGVDINEEMIKTIKSNIKCFIDDGIEFLKKQENESANIISAFHLIEHIPFEKTIELIKEAFRVLDKEGILILETPNPENLKVASEKFYLDYTHIKPIPMELLKFAVELAGFKAKILRLNNSKIGNSIKDVIEGVSPDYAVIGFKDVSLIDEEFFKNGVSLDLAMFAFEERIKNIENIIVNLDKKLQNEHLKIEIEKLKMENQNLKNTIKNIENENQNLKNTIKNIENENQNLKNTNEKLIHNLNHIQNLYEDVINSTSWKITKPLREFMNFLRNKKRKTILKITSPKQEEITLSNRAKEIYKKLKKEIDDTH